ncbi:MULTISPECIES: transcriptional repressor LexA [unclassified Luteimonas]|uniref:transcriptional repressor LexA n=1 Tax=unclassified Luteimonas TaxID=2629088 RepID=UPI0018F0D198|nr:MULTISPECIES: transcriptional repressor LexA [unclassified Luteimonas]MBJ6978254.1 transcriptional repressor LexA [Luteimonas sp. MC1895]MBJ6984052.1 transcriptional repressor LexA [Luteimonas sp. MC1750]QQO06863.1 transcriptional repressor LexA [Luteimonas sp. MC1750]
MDITDTQQAVLALIAERIAEEGMPPSQAEIARAFGFSSVRAAQYHLEALEAAGAIERVPGRARGIRVLRAPAADPAASVGAATAAIAGDATARSGIAAAASPTGRGMDVLELPVLGQVAAGVPIGADIGSEQMVLMDRAFFSPAPDYLLRVRGDSMRDEGIFDGDLIGVHRTADARSGQIVIARIDDEITVKLLKVGKDRIRLLPRNPDYEPIEVAPGQDFAIEGLYCGLVRPNR